MTPTTTTKENLIERISHLTVINQIVETIYVNESIGQIEIDKTIKENDVIRHINEKLDYKLKSHRLIIKNDYFNKTNIVISDLPKSQTICNNRPICQCVSSDINHIFISELKSFKNIQKSSYQFFNQNFIKRLISPNTESDLVKHILNVSNDCSWIIVPTFILDIIKDSEWFESTHIHSESIIYNAGKLSDISVYVNPEENESIVYFGNYDSISIVINKNIKEDSMKSAGFYKEGKTIIVDYLFLERGVTKYLAVI
jgi:hypothetical protein